MSKAEDDNPLPNNIELKNKTLFYGNLTEAINYLNVVSEYVDKIQSYKSIRLIVLETWLLLDFTMRQLILAGLGLSKYENEELNLKSRLLPRSFRNCLNLITKLRDYNKGLPQKPPEDPFSGSLDYVSYLIENDREATEKISKLTDEYFEVNSIPKPGSINKSECRFVNENWLQVTEQIDDDWRKMAEKMNAVRNLAAHSYSDRKIANKLGFHGDTALIRVKEYCLEIFETMLGIKPITKEK